MKFFRMLKLALLEIKCKIFNKHYYDWYIVTTETGYYIYCNYCEKKLYCTEKETLYEVLRKQK